MKRLDISSGEEPIIQEDARTCRKLTRCAFIADRARKDPEGAQDYMLNYCRGNPDSCYLNRRE